MATAHPWTPANETEGFTFATHLPHVDSRADLSSASWSWPGGTALLRRGLKTLVSVEDDEVASVLQAFGGFTALLGAYFICLPLRDEAGMSLGTSSLPSLFVSSLVVTLLAAPASSALLTRTDISKGRALLILYRFFGASLLVFFFLFLLVPGSPHPDKADGFGLSLAFVAVRASFFLWVALFNLFTVSAMWARLADIMSSEAGGRLFGFIGAGATVGQLAGSIVASALASSGPALLLVAVVLMEAAGWCGFYISEDPLCAFTSDAESVCSAMSPQQPPMGPKWVDEERAEGPIAEESGEEGGGGGWGGREGGEGEGEARASEPQQEGGVGWGGVGGSVPPCPHPETLESHPPEACRREGGAVGDFPEQAGGEVGSEAGGGGGAQLIEGVKLVLASNYLLHLCLFLMMTAVVSSFFYFERAAVVAKATGDPVARRRWLANINVLSAIATAVFQITLSGRLLSLVGIAAALSAAPLTAILGMAAIAVHPSATVVAAAEAGRKMVNYVLTRPGREILFTVITREEKYKAKVTIDTLVQRLGDAAAAGVFRVLGGWLRMGPAGVAAAAIPLCALWLALGWTLGVRQQGMVRSASAGFGIT